MMNTSTCLMFELLMVFLTWFLAALSQYSVTCLTSEPTVHPTKLSSTRQRKNNNIYGRSTIETTFQGTSAWPCATHVALRCTCFAGFECGVLSRPRMTKSLTICLQSIWWKSWMHFYLTNLKPTCGSSKGHPIVVSGCWRLRFWMWWNVTVQLRSSGPKGRVNHQTAWEWLWRKVPQFTGRMMLPEWQSIKVSCLFTLICVKLSILSKYLQASWHHRIRLQVSRWRTAQITTGGPGYFDVTMFNIQYCHNITAFLVTVRISVEQFLSDPPSTST